jgi:hypothetical protein
MDAYDEPVAVSRDGKPSANWHEYDEPDHNAMIERITLGLFTLDDMSRSWAEEMEKGMGLEPQGEYIAPNYPPTPAPPSPAPLHPPLPPTSFYTPPRPYYKPSHA